MNEEMRISLTLQFDYPVSVWVLQAGGWMPIQLTSAPVILVDRCVISALSDLEARPDRTDMDAERWWLGHLNSRVLHLNAFFCAAEGCSRSEPTFEEFLSQLGKANSIISRGLPEAQIVQHDRTQLVNLYDSMVRAKDYHKREARFLRRASPLIGDRVPRSRTRIVEHELLEAAHSLGLAPKSIVVLGALSCLYEAQDGGPPLIGRQVLKPSIDYTDEDAHNALSDLRSLECLLASSGLGGPAVGLCTRDKWLAAFWTYLGTSEGAWEDGTFRVTLQPNKLLFPRLSEDEVSDLLSRLS